MALSVVHCCPVFMLGYSFTNIKPQNGRCDVAGFSLPWHESSADLRGDSAVNVENTLEFFLGTGLWWDVPARNVIIFSLTPPPLVSGGIAENIFFEDTDNNSKRQNTPPMCCAFRYSGFNSAAEWADWCVRLDSLVSPPPWESPLYSW